MRLCYLRTTSRPGEVSVEIDHREARAQNPGFGHMKHALRFVVFKSELSLAGRLLSTDLTFLWSHLTAVGDYALPGRRQCQARQPVSSSPSTHFALLPIRAYPGEAQRPGTATTLELL